jgi:hypothetical protein
MDFSFLKIIFRTELAAILNEDFSHNPRLAP